jgi:hypothetical protein
MISLEVCETGPLALVEDLGRAGLAHVGVTRSGAADRRAPRGPRLGVARRVERQVAQSRADVLDWTRARLAACGFIAAAVFD